MANNTQLGAVAIGIDVQAAETIAIRRFCAFNVMGLLVAVTTLGQPIAGVIDTVMDDIEHPILLSVLGVVEVEAANSIAAGVLVMTDAVGKVTPFVSGAGRYAVGISLPYPGEASVGAGKKARILLTGSAGHQE